MAVASSLIHPMRYMRTRPFAQEAVRTYIRTCGRSMPTPQMLEVIGGLIISSFNEAIKKLPREKRPQRATAVITQEGSLAVHVGRHSAFGRNIYVMAPDLLAMLDRTDLDSIRARDIQLPFEAFYISFGDAFNGCLPGPPNHIDGAYVSRSGPNCIEVVVTSRRLDTKLNVSTRWPFSRDLYYYAPLDTGDQERSFTDILNQAVGTEIKISASATEPDPEMVVDLSDGRTVAIHDIRHLTEAEQAAYNREGLPAFQRALTLIINGLCYISAEPQDTLTCLPDDAPPDLAADIQKGKRGQRARAKAQLLDRGFSFIHIIGDGIRKPRPIEGMESAAEVLPHWRRGHWRRQPYGPRRIEIKLTWIKPTIVKADRGDPQQGHVYQVG